MTRLFIALSIDDQVRSFLRPVYDHLCKFDFMLKVVPPENYHITLKFLGNCDDNLTAETEKAFLDVKIKKDKIPFNLSGIGAFPNIKKANVIWTGLKTDIKKLELLYNSIEMFTSGLGFKEENRQFQPHLTLARTRKGRRITDDLYKFIKDNNSVYFGNSFFHKIVLYSSKITPQGPIYTERKSIDL